MPLRTADEEANSFSYGHTWAAKIQAQEMSVAEWALEVEGVLKGETINGGLGQFIDNRPFLVPEAARLIDIFGPPDALRLFARMTSAFVGELSKHRADLIAAESNGDDDWRERYYRIFDKHIDEIVDDVDYDAWHRLYFGNDDGTYEGEGLFGSPRPGEGWDTTIARNVLTYCIEHATDFGVSVEYSN